jgi:hypothetical protein
MVEWKIPLNADTKEHEALVTIGDSSGKQIFHAVRIKVD